MAMEMQSYIGGYTSIWLSGLMATRLHGFKSIGVQLYIYGRVVNTSAFLWDIERQKVQKGKS